MREGENARALSRPFGTMPDGTPVEQYTLRAGALSCDIITYGGTLRALRVPDQSGNSVDVLLGFDTLEDYIRQDKYIGAHIGDNYQQLAFTGGYDHNWVLDGKTGALRLAARAACPATGITMEVLTTLPGIQFYSGNYLDGCPVGKGDAPYARCWAFCLETQFFPDAPKHPGFLSCVLHPGQTWTHTTAYRFTAGKAAERSGTSDIRSKKRSRTS